MNFQKVLNFQKNFLFLFNKKLFPEKYILEKRAKGIIVSILEISKNRNIEGIENMSLFLNSLHL